MHQGDHFTPNFSFVHKTFSKKNKKEFPAESPQSGHLKVFGENCSKPNRSQINSKITRKTNKKPRKAPLKPDHSTKGLVFQLPETLICMRERGLIRFQTLDQAFAVNSNGIQVKVLGCWLQVKQQVDVSWWPDWRLAISKTIVDLKNTMKISKFNLRLASENRFNHSNKQKTSTVQHGLFEGSSY